MAGTSGGKRRRRGAVRTEPAGAEECRRQGEKVSSGRGSVTANRADGEAGLCDARARGRGAHDGSFGPGRAGLGAVRRRVCAQAPERALGGRAGTRCSHALGPRPGASAFFRFRRALSVPRGRCMCGNSMSAPVPVIVPASRKATAAVSGGGRSSEGPARPSARDCPSGGGGDPRLGTSAQTG